MPGPKVVAVVAPSNVTDTKRSGPTPMSIAVPPACAATASAAAIAGCPLAAHALALTVVGGDGRVACGL